jgi:glycosyltransferase involved in cell wall biosynthesis
MANAIVDHPTARRATRPLRIVFAPDYRAGITYQEDLANALKDEDVCTRFLSHYRRGLPLYRGGRDLAPWDALHMHWPEAYMARVAWRKVRFAVDLALSLGNRPLFLTAHNLYPHNRRSEFLMHSVLRHTVRSASAIFVHSLRAANLYADRFGARDAQCRLIPFGDHAAEVGSPVDRLDARHALGLDHDDPICLMFGTVSPYKGQEDVIAAWKTVRMPARLAIVGPAVNKEYAAKLQQLSSGASNVLLRIGEWLKPADLRLWLSASDATVFNYRDILTSGAGCLARSFGLPILFPARLDAVDIGEPHASVFRFQSLIEDFPTLLGRAVARGLRYAEAAEWREQTKWSAVAAATAKVYREIIQS